MDKLIWGQLPEFWIAFGGVAVIVITCAIVAIVDHYKQIK